MDTDNRIMATYLLKTDEGDVCERARDICLEQTVEVPGELVRDEWIAEHIVGKVEDIKGLDTSVYQVSISFSDEITGYTLSGLLNLIYGNISLKKGILLTRLELPESFNSHFRGPAFGIPGIRELSGVENRPLLAAPLKPMGADPAKLGELCYELACGGIDIIKDDHGLSDQCFCPFRERVQRCVDSIKRAFRETGKRTLYFPCVMGEYESMQENILWAKEQGVDGILLSPMITGIEYMRFLSSHLKVHLPIMAHPSLMGAFFSHSAHGISHVVLLGTLMRLAGADMVIYPNFCGRFPFSREDCIGINNALREPLNHIIATFPVPAGGISLDNIPSLRSLFGVDVVFLIGSSLFSRKDSVRNNVRYLLSLIEHR